MASGCNAKSRLAEGPRLEAFHRCRVYPSLRYFPYNRASKTDLSVTDAYLISSLLPPSLRSMMPISRPRPRPHDFKHSRRGQCDFPSTPADSLQAFNNPLALGDLHVALDQVCIMYVDGGLLWKPRAFLFVHVVVTIKKYSTVQMTLISLP